MTESQRRAEITANIVERTGIDLVPPDIPRRVHHRFQVPLLSCAAAMGGAAVSADRIQITPIARIASATRTKPAIFAPRT